MAEYIDRQAAIDIFENLADEGWNKNAGTTWANAFIEVAGMIAGIPTADVRPVHRGRWALAEDGWYCTVCKLYPPFDCDPEEKGVPYCPYCGADIRGDESK